MFVKIFISSLFKVTALIFLCFNFIIAQEKNQKKEEIIAIDSQTYQQVLDIVFSTKAKNNVFGYGFVLRFLPSFDAESQITIENELGKTIVTEYKSVNGNIYEQINKLVTETDIEDAEELAKRIKIEKRSVNIPPNQTKQWREEFYRALSLSMNDERKKISENMKETIDVNDGIKYSLWYSGSAKIFYEFTDETASDNLTETNENAIVSWMRKVKSTVIKSK